MSLLSKILILLVALIHLYIMWLEMFGWTTRARKVFRKFPDELFHATKPMAANQGLYNGFLAAGLIWSLFITDLEWSINVALFFLLCIGIAGLYGSATVQRSILYVQTLPAFITIVSLLFLEP